MKMVALGKTGLYASKVSIGTVPFQRLEFGESVRLLRRCFEGGVRFFDTSDNYDGSDAKLGEALRSVRSEAAIATKITPSDYAGAKKSIEKSLCALKTDYIDLIQLHNPKTLPAPDDTYGAYAAAVEAKAAGLVRHIGCTTHTLSTAFAAARSGLFETIQYPLNYLSNGEEDELISLCGNLGIGLVAMKPFAGGMITEPDLTFHYFNSRENVVPVYGIQRDSELDALLALEKAPPVPDEIFIKRYEEGIKRYAGYFCRGCEVCAGVCPEGIRIGYAGRLGSFFYRNPPSKYIKDETWYNEMKKVENCRNCGKCAEQCVFGLDLRLLMKESVEIFMKFWERRYEYIDIFDEI